MKKLEKVSDKTLSVLANMVLNREFDFISIENEAIEGDLDGNWSTFELGKSTITLIKESTKDEAKVRR